MSNNDTELFELCKQVYEATGWDERKFYATKYGVLYITQLPGNIESDEDVICRTYTSDFILEKLPEWIGDYGSMTMDRGYMHGGTGAFRYKYSRDNSDKILEGTGTTSLKALLKLTLALKEAGLLEASKSGRDE